MPSWCQFKFVQLSANQCSRVGRALEVVQRMARLVWNRQLLFTLFPTLPTAPMPWMTVILSPPSSPNYSHSGIPHQPSTSTIAPFTLSLPLQSINTHLDTFYVFHPKSIPSPRLLHSVRNFFSPQYHTPNNVVKLVFAWRALHNMDASQSPQSPCRHLSVTGTHWFLYSGTQLERGPLSSIIVLFSMTITNVSNGHCQMSPIFHSSLLNPSNFHAFLLCWSWQYGGQLRNRGK